MPVVIDSVTPLLLRCEGWLTVKFALALSLSDSSEVRDFLGL